MERWKKCTRNGTISTEIHVTILSTEYTLGIINKTEYNK